MSKRQSGELRKLDFISSLRGWAAVYVASIHLTFSTAPKVDAPPWLVPAIAFGNTAVTLFFVLSAFTLCLSMEARSHERHPTISFYVRRFFRIAPLYYGWVALSVFISWKLYDFHPTLEQIVLSVLFLFNLVPGHEWGLAYAGWSIGTEMLFYLIFPAIFATSRRPLFLVFWVAGSVVISQISRVFMMERLGIAWPFPYTSVVNQLPVFIFGVAVFHIYAALRKMPHKSVIGGALLLISVVGMYLMAYPFRVDRVESSLYLRAFLCGAFILGMGLFPLRALVNPWTVFAGEISYSIYLNHTFGCILVERVAPHIYSCFSVLWSYVMSYLLLLAIVVPLSYATYRMIEQTGNATGRALIRRLHCISD